MKKTCVFLALLALALLCLAGCAQKEPLEKYERAGIYFDTVVQISFYAGSEGEAWMDRCMQMCADFEKIFSRTDKESELYAVNHRSSNRVAVSDDLAAVIEAGLSGYALSGGKFDITVAPLSDLWDFKSENASVPAQADLEAALAKVDAAAVHLDGNNLTFDTSETMLDLGALAKGYISDQIKAYLRSEGVKSGLINLGGNVLTIGKKPDGEKWKIGVQKPFADRGQTTSMVEVADQAVISSGIYERYFEQGGKRYHHVLDPDTGYPVETDLEGVTIVCETGLMGDLLSTCCLLLGQDGAEDLIGQMDGVEATFLPMEEAGQPETALTGETIANRRYLCRLR